MAKQPYETERWAMLRESDSWARKNPDLANKGDPMLFFSYLQSERSELLDFKSRGGVADGGFRGGALLNR